MRTVLLVLISLSVTAPSPAGQADSLKAAPPADTAHAFPVVLDGDTVFEIQNGAMGFSPRIRASTISDRIRAYADDLLQVDSITIREVDVATEIAAGERLLLVVQDADASAAGMDRHQLALEYAGKIRAAVERYRKDYSASGVLRGAFIALLATIVLIVLLKGGNRIYKTGIDRLDTRLQSISSRKHAVVQPDRIRGAVTLLAKGIRAFLLILLLYAYLEVVLSAFAWTRPLATSLFSLILSPLELLWSEFVLQLPNLIFIVVLAFLTHYLLKGIRFVFGEVEKGRVTFPGFYPDWSRPTYNIIRFLVIAFALVVAFPYIPGSSSAAFQGVSIFLGVLLSFGSSSAVANIVAGVILTYMRAFKIGDYVKISETVGTVVSSKLLVTRVLTPKNVEITVPNSAILATHVTNYSAQARQNKLMLNTTVTIGYDAPWRQVHALLQMAAERTERVLKDPSPFVLQNSLDDFYVSYELNVYTNDAVNMVYTYADLHKHIQDAFNEYGVQIMSPNYMTDRAKPPIVPKNRWYAPPARKPGKPGAER